MSIMRRVYYRLFHARLMRLGHRYGWHHMRVLHPEGDTLFRCDWCGITHLRKIDHLQIEDWKSAELRSIS